MPIESSASTQTAVAAVLGALGGSASTAVAVFFLKDFFATTKKDLTALTKGVIELTTELRNVIRHVNKLEGAIEAQQKQTSDSIREMATSTANIKALWAALKRIHPAAIPDRLSDSRG